MDTSTNALTDPDFINAREDKRWQTFEDRLIKMITAKNGIPYKDVEYARRLWRMQAYDQACYDEISLAVEKTSRGSTIVMALWSLKEMYNQANVKELEELIAEKGWPRDSEVGEKAGQGAFLVIQHSDYEKQKKYLPEIEKLCKQGEADWRSYALMYDRIQVHEDKPQKYGSQVRFNEQTNKYEFFPLLDSTKVNQWRAEIGLQSLEEYGAHWDIEFGK